MNLLLRHDLNELTSSIPFHTGTACPFNTQSQSEPSGRICFVVLFMKRKRWGKNMKISGTGKNVEKLVVRGEAYISLDFLETWDKDLRKLNRKRLMHRSDI